jgi:hypothetical protein
VISSKSRFRGWIIEVIRRNFDSFLLLPILTFPSRKHTFWFWFILSQRWSAAPGTFMWLRHLNYATKAKSFRIFRVPSRLVTAFWPKAIVRRSFVFLIRFTNFLRTFQSQFPVESPPWSG